MRLFLKQNLIDVGRAVAMVFIAEIIIIVSIFFVVGSAIGVPFSKIINGHK
jgi:hypothetical protein